ncbi:hypothetical protein [Gemelliphila palaticanis]|uniref:Uncharacterized protein n=1 Tax=Gemelliphila palaticanis TaxID=81950 RepID=A0ABX2T0J2_9BACL|nr:hypothetical protein [Gemella palaticanis]MBF0715014.1 hypothetical protein [Gemella palaticanis]NYS46944.1 hypothetical protein [Gemella palaticanis]
MIKKRKLGYFILIFIIILLVYTKYNFSKFVSQNNIEHKYRKENADKLIKSSDYKGIYIDIYKFSNDDFIIDTYSNDIFRADSGPMPWKMPQDWTIESENIKIEWEEYPNYIEAKVMVVIDGEVKYTVPHTYY